MARAEKRGGTTTAQNQTLSPADLMTASTRHIALLAAMIAICGSLFFSEVLQWIPCELCWYQRILMYPIALILLVGIWRQDRGIHWYVLPLSLTGMAVSLYHYLVVMLILPPPACAGTVPCAIDYINIPGALSFVKVPFLALVAFIIINVMMGNHLLTPVESRNPGRARNIALGIVIGTIVVFVGLGMLI